MEKITSFTIDHSCSLESMYPGRTRWKAEW